MCAASPGSSRGDAAGEGISPGQPGCGAAEEESGAAGWISKGKEMLLTELCMRFTYEGAAPQPCSPMANVKSCGAWGCAEQLASTGRWGWGAWVPAKYNFLYLPIDTSPGTCITVEMGHKLAIKVSHLSLEKH